VDDIEKLPNGSPFEAPENSFTSVRRKSRVSASLKVLIADDHFLIRQFVRNVLQGSKITDVQTATRHDINRAFFQALPSSDGLSGSGSGSGGLTPIGDM
jgi:hypothetical protein